MDNILDKVIQSEQDELKAKLNPRELVNFLLKDLNMREKEVIKARYGLDQDETATLEAIGRKFSITRERVRQIETSALGKARRVDGLADKLADLINLITKNLKQHGHFRLENSLINDLLGEDRLEGTDRNCLLFIFKEFLQTQIEPVIIIHADRAWKLKEKDHNIFSHLVEAVKNILSKKNEPMALTEIHQLLPDEIGSDKIKTILTELEQLERALHSYLEISRHFKKNLFDKWGLSSWRSVNPKRMRDKIYLVLSKYKRPLHFKDISEKINQEQFDNKKAHPPTIHNELILDDRFVLIGRGIYALVEWGYEPGSIAEVITNILKDSNEPMAKDQIIAAVLKHRQVKAGSINLALLDKTRFGRLEDGRYALNKQ